MRVLAVNQFYFPDHAATSQLLTQLCEDLVAAGDEVTVVASRGSYLGGGKLPARERVRGVEIVRAPATSLGKRTIAHRLADYGSFWATSVATLAAQRRPDVLLALTTPPMIAAGAAAVATARRTPLVTWVQDVYPEVAVAFGVLREGQLATRALAGMTRLLHARSARSVVLSEGMAARVVAQGQRPDRVRVVANWSDGAAVRPVEHETNLFRKEHDLEGRFVVMYSGNLGAGHDVVTPIAAVEALAAQHPDLVLLFVGEGARRAEAEARAQGLTNVRFLPYQPADRLAESLSAADLHLASLQEGLEGLLVPSKLYGVLAAGRPLLYIGPATCEVSRVVTAHDVGWSVRAGDVAGVTAAIAEALADRARNRDRGARSRHLFETVYDRPHAVRRFRELLIEVAAGAPKRL